MRRWQAIPVAAFIAIAAGVMSWSASPTPTEAGESIFTIAADCDTATAGIQTSCIVSPGTVTVDIYVTNNSGSSHQVGAWGFEILTLKSVLQGTVVACDPSGLNCNPDFDQAVNTGGWACSPPAPNPYVGPPAQTDPTVNRVFIGCFNGALDGQTIANGATQRLARVTYVANNGVTTLDWDAVSYYDVDFTELGSCFPVITTAADCSITTIQVGASAATATPTFTPTVTNTPTPTRTPCVGASCPTATSLAYDTVTPTPGPETPTTVPGQPTTPPGATPGDPGAPGGGGAPGGNTGGGGSGPIRLPDTGTEGGNSGMNWMIAFAAAAALGSAGIAGGLWFRTAAARRRGED